MKRTLIHNETIVNEGRSVQGSVVIEGDRIAEVLTYGKKLSVPCDETIDATGCCLLPGIIDDHVHFRDPGLTHKADIFTESRAAAAGGVTSIMDMPNTNPLTTTLSALEQKFDAKYTMFVQLVEFRIVIISGSEVAGVVNNALLIQ